MIEFFMPVMRVNSALRVLKDLENQTYLIDQITIIDNCNEFKLDKEYPFVIKILKPGSNIGPNAAWNYMFESKADFIGLLGDDFELENRLIEILLTSIQRIPNAGAVTATIFNDKKMILSKKLTWGKVVGRGHFGATLFKKCTLTCLPKIPEELFIFYGDNWLGYWLLQIGCPLLEVSAAISHQYKTDLKNVVDYMKKRGNDKVIWNNWKAGLIEL